MSYGDESEYSDNSSEMSTNDNDEDSVDESRKTLYEKIHSNEIDHAALEKFEAMATNKEVSKTCKKSSNKKSSKKKPKKHP